jgi:salicylate hydroxylase
MPSTTACDEIDDRSPAPTMTAARKALVIGSGIGGLAAAIGLRRAGLEVEVFERTAELREVGADVSRCSAMPRIR